MFQTVWKSGSASIIRKIFQFIIIKKRRLKKQVKKLLRSFTSGNKGDGLPSGSKDSGP